MVNGNSKPRVPFRTGQKLVLENGMSIKDAMMIHPDISTPSDYFRNHKNIQIAQARKNAEILAKQLHSAWQQEAYAKVNAQPRLEIVFNKGDRLLNFAHFELQRVGCLHDKNSQVVAKQ